MDTIDERIEIVPFEDRYAKAFKQLNLEWLKKYDLFEPMDLKYLDQPRQAIIDRGGKILMTLTKEKVVGTCAILKKTVNTAEFAKLTVLTDVRKKGIGSLLTIASINLAQKMGFKKIVLASNKRLTNATRLYESFGFMHVPDSQNKTGKAADIYMELKIS